MQVQVSGKHVDVGVALRERVDDELQTSIGKYFDRGGDADVVVSRDGYGFRVDCTVALASGQRLLSHGQAGEAHAAFSLALGKIETRIRRYKRRLKSHSVAAGAKAAETASLMVLRAPEGVDDDEDWDAADDRGAPAAMVIAETLERGQDLVLEIDWQGAAQVRRLYPDCVGIFILPPSVGELERRLRARGQDSEAVIASRLANAQAEMAHAGDFEYRIINKDFDTAKAELERIVRERRRNS